METLNTLEVGIICDFRQIEPTQKGVTPLPLRNNSGRRKGDAQCVFKRSVCLCISAGWRQEGHPACEILHQNLYFKKATG